MKAGKLIKVYYQRVVKYKTYIKQGKLSENYQKSISKASSSDEDAKLSVK